MNPRVVTQPLSGNSLALAAAEGKTPEQWYESRPGDTDAWRARLEVVRGGPSGDWLSALTPAFDPSGVAAERLASASKGRGAVVTTGQQPGLFGGPLYTLCKALSALALADQLQEMTGIPVAPVFWAATDDADFREASVTAVSVSGGAQRLKIDHQEALGRSMADMPLGDVSAELEALSRAAGSTIDQIPLDLLKKFYNPRATIGAAYVSLLRELFAPLGIAVLDAAHAATRSSALPVLRSALEKSGLIAERLAARSSEIEAVGHKPQVHDVAGLSLVFSSEKGERKRIPIKAAARHLNDTNLGPNVLLRPIVERALLPTVTYVGGAAEIAYFAQIGPIADAIGAARPAIVPRWSCTIIEPHVERILEKLYLLPEDLQAPHEVEHRVAHARLPKPVIAELAATRAALNERLDALSVAVDAEHAPVSAAVTGGLRANLMRRLDRFERRLVAAAKRQHAETMEEIATARGSLYPFGATQERILNFVPFLARYGRELQSEMLSEARRYAAGIAGTTTTRGRSVEIKRQPVESTQ